MNRMSMLIVVCIGLVLASSSHAEVVINEFAYDDSGTDTHEYVELYNNGSTAVDIGGWLLINGVTVSSTTTTIVPGASIPPGGFYVMGQIAGATQPLGGALQDNKQYYDLFNALSELQDSVVVELNQTTGDVSTHGEPIGLGIQGRNILVEVGNVSGTGISDGSPNASFSIARYYDGVDTNNNEMDFGVLPATPNALNYSKGVVSVTSIQAGTPYVENFDASDNTFVMEMLGSLSTVQCQNPAVADPLPTNLLVGACINPSVIPASPQGGNVGILFNPRLTGSTGSGESGILNLTEPITDCEVEFYTYMPAKTQIANQYGVGTLVGMRGHPCPVYGFTSPDKNGDTGIRVRWENDYTKGVHIWVEERLNNIVTPIGMPVTITSAGWIRVLLQVNGTGVYALVGGAYGSSDGTVVQGTTTITQAGQVYFGYGQSTNQNTFTDCRPNTYDAFRLSIPTMITPTPRPTSTPSSGVHYDLNSYR